MKAFPNIRSQILAETRFYAILDTGWVQPDRLVSMAEALVSSGVRVLQLRAKDWSPAEVEPVARSVAQTVQDAGGIFILNDHAELAAAIPGAGLHVGQEDLSPTICRSKLGPDRVIGISTHSPSQAADAIAHRDLLDYFAVGPVFKTQTKPNREPVGLELVSHVASLNPPLPWFAIGGITRKNVKTVRDAGASGIVAVSDILTASDISAAVAAIQN